MKTPIDRRPRFASVQPMLIGTAIGAIKLKFEQPVKKLAGKMAARCSPRAIRSIDAELGSRCS
jgi:hypothetical protein